MNAREFYDKVKALRKAQKIYLNHRCKENLIKVKILENEIDKEIERVEKCLRLCLPNRFNNNEKVNEKG